MTRKNRNPGKATGAGSRSRPLHPARDREPAPGPRRDPEPRLREHLYRTTIDSLQDWLVVVDRDLKVVLANEAFCQVLKRLGFGSTGIVGRDLFELQPFLADPVRREYLEVFRDGRELITHEDTGIQGQVFFTESRKIPIIENGRVERVLTIIRDSSRAVRMERVKAALYRISESAASAPDLDSLYRSIHQVVGELMPARVFAIALLDSERGLLVFPYSAGRDPSLPPLPPERALGRGRAEYVIRSARPLLATPQVYRELISRGEVEAAAESVIDWLGVPLKAGERVIGAMVVQSSEQKVRYGPEELEILTYVSEQVAMAIQRKRAEIALRDGEERFRITAEKTGQLLYDYDVASGTIVWAGAIEPLTGFTPAEFARVDIAAWEEMIHPNDRPGITAELQRAMEAAGEFDVSYRFRCRAGHYIHVDDHGVFLRDGSGRAGRMLGTMTDISARVRSVLVQEAVYQISEAAATSPSLGELFHQIHAIVGELMPAPNFYIAIHDPVEDLIRFPYFVDQLDPPPAPKPPGRGLTEYVMRSGRLLLATAETLARLDEQGEVDLVGSPCLGWLGVPLRAENRVMGAMVVQSYDPDTRYGPDEAEILTYVSEQAAMAIQRKRTESELQTSEAQFRAIFEQAGIGIVMSDLRLQRVVRWNPACRNMLGYDDDEMVTLTNPAITHPEDLERERPLWRDVQEGRSNQYQLEKRYIRKDGRTIWVRQASTFIRDGDGSLRFGIDILEDVTEHRLLEEQFRQAQKMETVGRLAGGVAHDFNNLLGGIIGYADLLKESLPKDDPLQHYSQVILDTAERAAGLTRQLLTFSRKGKRATAPVDMHQAVNDVVGILQHTLDRRIRIVTRLQAAARIVDGDASLLQTALLNLCINARDAMPEGGTMTIASADVPAADALRSGLASGPGLRLSIEDTGTGMDADVLEHLFEPFFTTKAAKGTGLGLSVVYATVKEHGGTIQAQSEPGRGTRFSILLPGHAGAVAAPAADAPSAPRGSGCILLVDDEEVIRDMGAAMLQQLGYETLLAEDGEAALDVYRRERDRIRLVILDVIMPRRNGPDTLRALRAIDPGVRVIMSSGFSFDYAAQKLLDEGARGFVEKPYRFGELSARIDEALKEG